MSDYKKYYYLKLKDNFFDTPEIKAIEGMQNGYEYICIIQKMYLRSLKRNGKLMLTDTIPYDINTLSSVLNHRSDAIKTAVELFMQLGLIQLLDDKTIYMLHIQNFVGESSTEADRIREYRKNIEEPVQKNNSVQMYDKCTPEIRVQSLEIKVKDNINMLDKPTIYSFKEFWNEYDKKIGIQVCQKKFNKLSEEDRKTIKDTIKDYVRSTPDKQFRPNPETYINNKKWNDEIIFKSSIDLFSNKTYNIDLSINNQEKPKWKPSGDRGGIYET